jgi:hypothetical protein
MVLVQKTLDLQSLLADAVGFVPVNFGSAKRSAPNAADSVPAWSARIACLLGSLGRQFQATIVVILNGVRF